MSMMQTAFEGYDRDNPHVYEMFKRFAFEAIKAGKKTLSAYMIFERMRWETDIVTVGDPFKVNNNYRPYYARKFMSDFPQYRGYFPTRRLRAM